MQAIKISEDVKVSDFRQQMAEQGLRPKEIILDGNIHRFPAEGEMGDGTSGAYCHYGSGGWFKNWKTMVEVEYFKGDLTEDDLKALKGHFSSKESNRPNIKAVRAGVRRLWEFATTPNSHPYLLKKGIIAPDNIRQNGDELLITLYNNERKICGMQRILPDGKKRFLHGTRKKGAFYTIKGNEPYFICEGFATGVSINMATGCGVVVSFDAGNLTHVAKAVREMSKSTEFIIAGDDDSWRTDKNVGLDASISAGRAISAKVVTPKFKDGFTEDTTDFNDLHAAEGINTVKEQLERVIYEKKKREYHFTDMGNAERLVDQHGHNLRYCYTYKKWFIWDSKRWNKDNMGQLRRMCKEVVKNMYEEAAIIEHKADRIKLIDYARRCETTKKARDMIEFAQSEHGIPVLPEHLDQNKYLLNCLNGTVDLKTGELRPHKREDLITKLAPVNYNTNAECTVWLDHLNKIMAGNQELTRFLQKAFGYSLTGDTSERKIFIQHGSGANGKSVTNDTIALIMGDYAMRTPTSTLHIKRSDGIPNDIARLKGARFVYASEAERGQRLAEAVIKDMTGGEQISARFLNQEWFDFYPEFKIWLGTNHKPEIRGLDPAIWDRIRLIPFTVRIPNDEQIPKTEMLELFKDEIDGIFSWLVKGCLAWQKEGLGFPKDVKEATKKYRNEMDILGDFLEDRCVFGETFTVSAADLYEAYVKWAEANGQDEITKTKFGRKLNDRGLDSYPGSNNVRMRIGIRLKTLKNS